VPCHHIPWERVRLLLAIKPSTNSYLAASLYTCQDGINARDSVKLIELDDI